MIWRTSTLASLLLAWCQHASAQQTWPSATDELEDILFLNSGYRSRHFADGVTPCSASPGGVAGRNAAAEWIRTAFHDMAPGNAVQGIGGLDASLMFETDRGENNGPTFTTTLTTYAPFLSSRLSMADIIAAGVYSATRSCGGPTIPVRGGRIDATQPGASGVPLPNDGTAVFTSRFTRMGYNRSEMIAFVACGHSLGGVHSADFPDIVPAGTAPNDYATLDSTVAVFDNKVVTEYFAGTTKNPLVVGPAVKLKKNADTLVYTADGNATMKTLQNAGTFSSRCKDMFQKMIEVVPAGVVLTDPVKPFEVKRYDVQLTLLDGGSQLAFTGDIRIRTTNRGTGSIGKVQLVYKDRTGATAAAPIDTKYIGDASGFDDTFSFFSFSTKLSADSSISSFNVLITNTPGGPETQSNGGNGFKVDDNVIFQAPQSCSASGNLTVVAAVRNSSSSSPTLQVVAKVPVAGVVVPSLSTTRIAMATQSAVGAYHLYSAFFSGSQPASFGVFSGDSSDNYKNASSLASACSSLAAPSSTSSSSSRSASNSTLDSASVSTAASESTSTPAVDSNSASVSSSVLASISTPTPSNLPFNFQGCYLDNGNPRALGLSGEANDNMTVERCAAFCSNFQLFGLEYGRECYCANRLASYSNLMGLSDCNMACSGNSAQMCGSGSRLSLYKNDGYSAPVIPQISGYNYIGCYSEATGGRALVDTSTTSDKMTVDSCATFCKGSTYFGLEYGSECYCGSDIQAGSTVQSNDDCNMLCGGNKTEYCGAGNRLNVYQQKLVSSSTPTQMAATTIVVSSTSTAVMTATVLTTSSVIDSLDPSPFPSSSSNVSSASISSSSDSSYSSSISSESSFSTSTGTTNSEFTSASAPLQTLQSSLADVSTISSEATSSLSSTNSSSLVSSSESPSPSPSDQVISSVSTPEPSSFSPATSGDPSPTNTPSSSSVSFSSVETSSASPSQSMSSIISSNDPSISTSSDVSTSSISVTANATATDIPGSTIIVTVTPIITHTINSTSTASGIATSPTDISTLTSSLIRSSLSSPSASTMPSNSSFPALPSSSSMQLSPTSSPLPSFPNYNYTGCLVDSVLNRTLSARRVQDDAMNYTTCAKICDQYIYFGVEYGRECYCGDRLVQNITAPGGESDCNVPCSGDASNKTTCGAPDRLNIFKSTTLFKSAGNPIVVGYNYTGCHTDSVQSRVLDMNHMMDSNMTVAKCAKFCGGSEYFGTQYGTECYCGDEFSSPSSLADEGDCSYACGGDSSEYCGAGDRLSMWQRIDN